MDPTAPAAAPPGLALAQAPAVAQINGQEVSGSGRETGLWRPWLSSINDQRRQVRVLVDWAAGGATAAEATKAESEFHHPVRLFWPKSRSFDYLYSAGEILLQNFPVQATINLYEDSDSNEDEEDKEEDEEEEVNEIGSEEGARVPEATEHKATAHSPEPPLTCPN
ncbi:protein ripply1 [Cricetulus griseus]|uniref:Protein ripply1 n=1 Tax=Cricetulus griseus TaxID=10029 RepID=G3I168_CRIGR|nr:protein ripply1 [Cricetulus griseus]XP_035316109.1 protein ripply1 [Cricetulus griseus]EGW07633.1 Protein ripply1 [Cricetulus griseus]ERE65760.1 protein ripply1-like protein [Cricetulus griseus]